MKIQVLGVVVLRIGQELGGKGKGRPEMGNVGGLGNVGGSEMGGRGNMGGSRGRKYETGGDGCTNRAFSGQPHQILIFVLTNGPSFITKAYLNYYVLPCPRI